MKNTKKYNPTDIEPKWQALWSEQKLYETEAKNGINKVYATPMLPYPSGSAMHTGHVRNYAIADVVARYWRQKGFNTLSTMAWDAFGLPAENYAIKTGTPPDVSTANNIIYFKKQLQRLGMSYDWSREFTTSDSSYYKWTQWVFSLMYKRGLAYKAEKQQWWCDKCNTVLADEQVTASGKCWRHDGVDDLAVTKKSVRQWFFKITDYADDMLNATDALAWPEKIKTMQKNWIGRSEGAIIRFLLSGDEYLEAYTTRPDTLFGVTFLVLAPEHPMVEKLINECDNPEEVESYCEKARRKSELERETEKNKTGVSLNGVTVIHPINGKQIPVWIADYVVMGYGTGVVMGVPAHDERDNQFAKKYNLEIIPVVAPLFGSPLPDPVDVTGPVVVGYDPNTKQYMSLINNKNKMRWFAAGGLEEGETYEQAAHRELSEEAGFKKVKKMIRLGGPTYSYFHNPNKNSNRRSFSYMFLAIISEQDQEEQSLESHENYTVVWSDAKTIVDDLKREPDGRGHWIDGMDRAIMAVQQYEQGQEYIEEVSAEYGVLYNSGEYNGLSSEDAKERIVNDLAQEGLAEPKVQYRIRDWLVSRQRYWGAPVPIVYCPDHGEMLVPEDQLPVELPKVDNYVPDGKNSSVLAGVEGWVNTTCPECGKPATRETDTMDGYVCSTWYLHRYTDAHNATAAFDIKKANYWFPVDFYFGGDHAVAHLLYIRFFQRVLFDAGLAAEKEPIKQLVYNGYINAEDGRKMSKSLGNTVDPMDIIESGYGADALRIFELFIAPYDQDTSWNSNGVPGAYRFLNRVWTLVQEFLGSDVDSQNIKSNQEESLLRAAHRAIKKVTDDLEGLSFNTAVAAMMATVNEFYLIKAQDNYSARSAWRFALESIVLLLAPFAPYIAEELWHELGHQDSVHIGHWPKLDEAYLVEEEVTCVVMINGKVKAEVVVSVGTSQSKLETLARGNEKVASLLTSDPKKIVFVQDKLINFVL